MSEILVAIAQIYEASNFEFGDWSRAAGDVNAVQVLSRAMGQPVACSGQRQVRLSIWHTVSISLSEGF